MTKTPSAPRPRQGQRGTVLIFTLIALAVMLIAGAALIRAMDSSLLQAGNLAYKRDLVNQAQRAMAVAKTALLTGALAAEATRNTDLSSANYSATRLSSNEQGIPSTLLASGTADLSDSDTGVSLRYVIDRQCAATGDYTLTSCVTVASADQQPADDRYRKVKNEARPVYRITVRASGPRNTEAYFQSTVVR